MKGKDGVQFIIPEGADTMIPKVRAHMHRLAVERCTEDRHVAISPAMLRSSNGIVEFKPTAARMSKSGLQVTYPQPRV